MSKQRNLMIGVDLGTSGVRAIAFDRRLRVVAQASRSYPVHFAQGGVAEQSVTDVITASEACISEAGLHPAVQGRVRGLILCGTASNLALFQTRKSRRSAASGRAFEPSGEAWLWADIRAAHEAQLVSQRHSTALYTRTGCPVHASYWPAKLLWWRNHGVAPWDDRVAAPDTIRLAGCKDYLLYRLTGEWVTDRSTAAATGLFNSQEEVWDRELLAWLQVAAEWLPRVVPITEQLALQPGAARRLQLPADTVVVAGGLDGVLTHLGMGCVQEGLASCTIGTSSAARMSAPQRVTDRLGRTWCYPVVDDLWLAGGAGNNGGNVLAWFLSICNELARLACSQQSGDGASGFSNITAEQVITLALESEPGADGLRFLPYLFGERSPLWREDLTGAFSGLSPVHTAAHLARSVLEGISLGVRGIYGALVDQLGAPREVRAGGGFVASHPWVQLQADVFGVPVAVTATGQETATGAAMIGWHAIAQIPLDELQDCIEVTARFEPRPSIHQHYQACFAQMEELRTRLAGPASSRSG